MNYRRHRANAWAGLYVGLLGDSTCADDGQASDDRVEGRRSEDGD